MGDHFHSDGRKIPEGVRIVLVGGGTIGLSFAGFHLQHLRTPNQLVICDTRPGLKEYIDNELPKYLPEGRKEYISGVQSTSDIKSAVLGATIVQEQGPENLAFKSKTWAQIERHAPNDALFWSSTSGIPASQMSKDMKDPSRLLVVHPYNPPHLYPILEVVPSPSTSQHVINQTLAWWEARGRKPVLLKKEKAGFVINRIAFALLRESVHLVNEGVVSVEDLDRIVEMSMGPRWAVAGPFKSYHAGGGTGGLEAWFRNIGGTVQECWEDSGKVNVGEAWESNICKQTEEAYGRVDTAIRDRITRKVLQVIWEEKSK